MGQPDRGNESWDQERLTAARLAALNGRVTSQRTGQHKAISTSTGEYRAIPQRPPNLPYLDGNPEKRRAPRPDYQQQKQPRRMRPRLLILGAVAAIIAIFVFIIFSLLIGALNQSSGPAVTAADFLASVSSQDYNNAYQYLGPAVTIRLNLQDFTQQAQALDKQDGVITNYVEIAGSATVNNNTESVSYTITRAKLSKSYKITLTLQQDPNDNNTWKIVDYGQTLGPPQP